MGLDVYVGTLSRYHTGSWETIVQQAAKESGLEVVVVRPDARPWWQSVLARLPVVGPLVAARATSIGEAQEGVAAWRAAISQQLAGDLPEALDWDESSEAPYFTDKPDWSGYLGLVLWAAHDEHPDLAMPETVTDLDKDPAWLACMTDGFTSRYRHILEPELWLPATFRFTFRAKTLSGPDACMGSSIALLEQLHDLNARTFNGGSVELEEWRREPCRSDSPLDDAARFGLSIFLDLAERSVRHRLPMKLDY